MLSRLRSFFETKALRFRRRQPQHDDDAQVQRDPRYAPCDVLTGRRIPCKIWCEDALVFYDVPTVVFDLFVLVSDPISAAGELVRAGYVKTQTNPRYKNVPQLGHQVMRLVQADENDPNVLLDDDSVLREADDTVNVGIVLLPGQEWGYNLPSSLCRKAKKMALLLHCYLTRLWAAQAAGAGTAVQGQVIP